LLYIKRFNVYIGDIYFRFLKKSLKARIKLTHLKSYIKNYWS